MQRPYRIEAYAIISADGMIADAAGQFPPQLRNEADKRFFHAGMDSAAAIALGRITHEAEVNSGRRRLVLTRRVTSLAPDPADPEGTVLEPGRRVVRGRAAGAGVAARLAGGDRRRRGL